MVQIESNHLRKRTLDLSSARDVPNMRFSVLKCLTVTRSARQVIVLIYESGQKFQNFRAVLHAVLVCSASAIVRRLYVLMCDSDFYD